MRLTATMTVGLTVGVLAVGLAAAPQAKPASPRQAAKATFSDQCAMCHNDNGQGYPGMGTPDFTAAKWQQAHTNAELAKAVADGVSGTAMPSFKDRLTPAQIQNLVRYVVRGFGRAPAEHKH